MRTQSAEVIDLEEYRRRRVARSEPSVGAKEARSDTAAAVPIALWFPVWTWMPVWKMP